MKKILVPVTRFYLFILTYKLIKLLRVIGTIYSKDK